MFDSLIDMVKLVLLVSAAIVVLAGVPLVISAICDASDAADEQLGEAYWLARGYDPLDASSTGESRMTNDK